MADTPPITAIASRGYPNPNSLVDCDWLTAHLGDPAIRLLQVDQDPLGYRAGHIPGALHLDPVGDLNHPLMRDYLDSPRMEQILRTRGINGDTTVVIYSDRNNAWACHAFWVLRLFGVASLRILDGGRARWLQEGRSLQGEVPEVTPGTISVSPRDDTASRAFRDDVMQLVATGGCLLDVRSPEEFRGEQTNLPEHPNEGGVRHGHIPGACNVPWTRTVDPLTAEFRSAPELRGVYEGAGLRATDPAVVYGRSSGESALTWFVLTELLAWSEVRNYDGGWVEWGNTVRAPIERS